MAAAVADFRPKAIASEKLKKRDGLPEIVLEPTPDILGALQQGCPCVYALLCSDALKGLNALPAGLRPLLNEVCGRLESFYGYCDANPSTSSTVGVTEQEDMDSCAWFSRSLRRSRPLRRYTADRRNAASRSEEKTDGRKKKRNKNLTHGIMLVHCLHGICQGFFVLRDAESPRDAFTTFYSRFPKAPGVIIYDRGCQLHKYCMKREAAFFSDCHFLVDRFHQRNHVGCSEGYDPQVYRNVHRSVDEGNTSLAEQWNARLILVKTSVAFMTQTHFMKYIRLVITLLNLKNSHCKVKDLSVVYM